MQNKNYVSILLLLLCQTLCAMGTFSKSDYHFIENDHSVALYKDKTLIWQFNYDQNLSKPYFHPISLVDGTVLTWESPPDHPWHHGLWFSWKDINGVNYWEEDRKTGQSKGKTDWSNVKVKKLSDASVQITMDLDYHEPGQSALLTEKRIMTISAPDASESYTINWISEFTAVADKVVLDRTPPPGQENGKSWGGYAGLSFRVCEGVKDALYINTAGPKELSGRYGGKSEVVEYSGLLGDTAFGIAILDHPNNLNSPSSWYLTAKGMHYFSPAVIFDKPHTMSKREKMTLKYRIIIHPERWDLNKLKEEHKLFIGDHIAGD